MVLRDYTNMIETTSMKLDGNVSEFETDSASDNFTIKEGG